MFSDHSPDVPSPSGQQEFRKCSRGYLPHYEQRGFSYFVTYRLADSLPQTVLAQLKEELAASIRSAGVPPASSQASDGLIETPTQRAKRLYEQKLQHYLDKGTGACYMNQPAVADIVEGALKHFDKKRYDLYVWSVMPNHVHVLFRPYDGEQLDAILHSWKSYSAKQANSILHRTGKFWQEEYYDHLVKNEAEFYEIQEYILNNPANAGLRNWKWVGFGNIYAERP